MPANLRESADIINMHTFLLHSYVVRLPTSLFYIERDPRSRTKIGERDTQLVHVNEATAV